MHNPQNGIAILHAVHQRTDSEQIINLVKGFILVHHLLINAEKVLCSAVNLPFDAITSFIFVCNSCTMLCTNWSRSSFFFWIFAAKSKYASGFQIFKAQILHFERILEIPRRCARGSVNIQRFLRLLLSAFRVSYSLTSAYCAVCPPA